MSSTTDAPPSNTFNTTPTRPPRPDPIYWSKSPAATAEPVPTAAPMTATLYQMRFGDNHATGLAVPVQSPHAKRAPKGAFDIVLTKAKVGTQLIVGVENTAVVCE